MKNEEDKKLRGLSKERKLLQSRKKKNGRTEMGEEMKETQNILRKMKEMLKIHSLKGIFSMPLLSSNALKIFFVYPIEYC